MLLVLQSWFVLTSSLLALLAVVVGVQAAARATRRTEPSPAVVLQAPARPALSLVRT